MEGQRNSHKLFSVVQFIALPYETIEDYVCVPDNWIVLKRPTAQKVAVAYPKNEDRYVTRDRVKRKEKYSDSWKFWTAEVRYQTDTFEDADFWIATRNENGPLVLENSSTSDTRAASTVDKKLRSSKRKSTSKSNEDTPKMTPKPYKIARKPLPRVTMKRPQSDETQAQVNTKRSKESTTGAAKATGTATQNASAEPGCSNTGRISEDGPEIIDIDESDSLQDQQPSENKDDSQNRLVIDATAAQNHSSAKSPAATSNNGTPVSQHIPESLSISARLFRKMKGKPSMVAKHPVIEEKIRLSHLPRRAEVIRYEPMPVADPSKPFQEPIRIPMMNSGQPKDLPASLRGPPDVTTVTMGRVHDASAIDPRFRFRNGDNVVSSSQNPSSSSQQRPNFAHYQDRDSRVRSEHRPISAAVDTKHRSIGRQTLNLNATSRASQREQLIDSPYKIKKIIDRQAYLSQCYKNVIRRPVKTPILPRNGRSPPPFESATTFANLSDSMQRSLLANRRCFLSREEQLQADFNQETSVIETHPDEIEYARMQRQRANYTNERNQVNFRNDIPQSPYSSDSDLGMDHDDAAVETTNRINRIQSTPRFVSEEQNSDQFTCDSIQICSTLNNMINVFDNLRASVLELTASFQTLVNNMPGCNSPGNSTSQAPMSGNVSQEAPLAAEETETAAPGRINSSGNQDSNKQ